MKIFIVCSTSFYDQVPKIAKELITIGHEVSLPNCYEDRVTETDKKEMTNEEYLDFFKQMYHESRDKISTIDAIMVLNFEKLKNGKFLKNYIGASTFLEMYEAFMQNKKIYIYNELPESDNLLLDEIKGFAPVILNTDLNNIK